ncbi:MULTISPECIES: hypothetical protein [Sphingomonas]|uniref:hypothetical protein n=1 Tax=Sphingomonas TaxID=13687 RepID=UPI002413A568|nr:hypothetical protein [Sphingomonas echinoides]
MTDALPDSPFTDRQPVDVPLNLMKMALVVLDQEVGATLAAARLAEAIEVGSRAMRGKGHQQ